MSAWISVANRLPDESANYIICLAGGKESFECWFDHYEENWYHDRAGYQKPTHWQPLPTPPEAE